ncbi:MAG: DNA methylase [Bacteroidales bacterium]|nr:DNA methylase [Bacteroidales bacterium]
MLPPTFIAIDLKSFYASVECVDRGLDPLTARLVVADPTRTDKTICLAVSPALKAYGIPGRARLFEVNRRVREINRGIREPSRKLDFIVAPPRMAHYMEVSSRVYAVYLKYVAPEDIHVYSIDEVFMDVTRYLPLYGLDAHDLAMKMVRDVLETTGITATAGIGTNLYLAKIAMDIEAKHSPADKDGVRVASLDEMTYRQKYWSHRPLTDFWRVGRGIAARLEANGMYTMGDVARCSVRNEAVLYRLFGVNAELLIDHAWGWEPCTMAAIKAYRPSANSLSSGQVLQSPYDFAKAAIIVREMTDLLVLDLVEKRLVTDQMVLHVGYDMESDLEAYGGPVSEDYYGRKVPKPAHGSVNLGRQTSSTRLIVDAVMDLYDRIVDRRLLVRRIYVVANHVVDESRTDGVQLNLFEEMQDDTRERSRQEAILAIRRRFGKNAILHGIDFEDGATTRERNNQIGGHKA